MCAVLPLPSASVDAVVCDLPFGRKFGTKTNMAANLPVIVTEMERFVPLSELFFSELLSESETLGCLCGLMYYAELQNSIVYFDKIICFKMYKQIARENNIQLLFQYFWYNCNSFNKCFYV